MTGKTHQAIGLAAGLTVFLATVPAAYNPATAGWVVVASSLGALLPDIDTPAAKIWSYVPLGRTVGELVDPLLGHRNLSHSLPGYFLFSYGAYRLLLLMPSYWGVNAATVGLCFAVSLASHLLADMVTVEGIPLLYPWQRSFGIPPKPFEGIRIMTGHWFENGIVFPLVNLYTAAFLYLHWEAIKRLFLK